MGVGVQHERAQLTQTRQSYDAVVEELTADLLDLIELGAYDKARALAVRYHFYHAHGALILALLEAERYADAEGALHDVLIGPLKERAMQEFTTRCFDELLYIPRMLHLLTIVQQHYYLQPIDPMTRLLVAGYQECPTFRTFIERWEHKLELLDAEAYGVAVIQQLLQYALMLDSKLRTLYEASPWSPRALQVEFAHPRHHREYALYEIIDVCYTNNEHTACIADSVVAVALNNVGEYTHGEAPPHYRQTTAKLDVRSIVAGMPREDAVVVLTQAELFDAHWALSLAYYDEGDHVRALKVAYELAEHTTITRESGNFRKELLRKTLLEYMLHVLSQLDQAGRDQIVARVASLIPSEYAGLCERIVLDDDIVCSDAVEQARQASAWLMAQPEIIF